MKTSRNPLKRFLAWHRSRKVRRARRIVSAAADTTAAGIGFILRTVLKAVLTVLLVLITTGLLFVCIFAFYVKTCLLEDLNVSLEEMTLSLSSKILYQDGNEWKELATLYSDEDRIWVDFENIPENLQHAAVAIEDKHFYTHKGVDWFRTVGAFANMFVGMRNNFGGSTITQQLIKNLTEYDDVTVQRKLLEIFRALEFEKIYTKDEIITWYLNEIYLGERCYGVGTASRMYFGKEVSELDLAECASLIGITNNPSLYDPYISSRSRERNKARAKTILWEMYDQGYITHSEYTAAVAECDTLHYEQGEEFDRPVVVNSYYVDTVIRDVIADLAANKNISINTAEHLLYNGGYRIYSCIDMRIQDIVDNMYENPANMPSPYRSSNQDFQSAIVIIQPNTGDIVALSGGVGEKTASLTLNRATQSTRPPGSSIKPLSVYSPAIDLGIVNQKSVVNDSPNIVLKGIKDWYPSNSGGYSGMITIRTALQYSKNTIAAQLLDLLGLQTSWDYLTNHYGLTTLVRDEIQDNGSIVTDFAYAPMALGQFSHGVTVREMAQAYTAFVNDGIMSYGRTYTLITDDEGSVIMTNPTRQIVSIKANTAYNMADMMQNAVLNGTGTDAYFSSTAVGGKTGTTTDDKDRYFVGFTMYYVAAVWTGYDQPEVMYFSGNPAAQIFRNIMSQIHAGYAYWSFPAATIEKASITPMPLATAEATDTPEPSDTPEPTEGPEETPIEVTPEPTEPPDPSNDTPEPITPEPITPDPWEDTPEPIDITPEPIDITPEPITPEPITPEPITPEPVTPEPVTPEPVTPEPVTPEPVTPEPVTPEPVTPEPVTPEPAPPPPEDVGGDEPGE